MLILQLKKSSPYKTYCYNKLITNGHTFLDEISDHTIEQNILIQDNFEENMYSICFLESAMEEVTY